MAYSFMTSMDSRTIAQILRDNETLQLQDTNVVELMRLTAERDLATYFHSVDQNGQPELIYKRGSLEEVTLRGVDVHPVTADDFYQLAMTLKQPSAAITAEFFGQPASKATLAWLICNIFGDAVKAGHLLAKHELIEATIQGDPEARKHVDLKNYILAGRQIQLPRQLSSVAEIRKLGSDLLIQHRRQNYTDGRPLRGEYYEIPNGATAERFGKELLVLAEQRRQQEAADQARRIHLVEQGSPISQHMSTLFAKSLVTAEPIPTNVRILPTYST